MFQNQTPPLLSWLTLHNWPGHSHLPHQCPCLYFGMYLIRLLWCQMRPRNDHKIVTVLVTSLSLLASPRAKQSQCSWRVNLPLQVTSFPEHEYCRSWCRGCLAEIYSFSHASPECSPGPESGSTWREEELRKDPQEVSSHCILLKQDRMT